MAQTYKILGQINPTGNTQSNVYTVPASTSTVISSIMVSNQSSANLTYSLIVVPTANYTAPAANKYFLARGASVPPNDVVSINLGLTLPANTVLAANASSSSLSFSAFGVEIS
jgi:hypothetical protein